MASSLKTGPSTPGMQVLAIPAVILLVLFLGYTSQILFYLAKDLRPGPPDTTETVVFNLLLLSLWWNYYKACTVPPGTYTFDADDKQHQQQPQQQPNQRWCKKCAAPKPPRAHHCRHCGRCIPKMDHHCPWTGNCVSLQTFPYFMRFLVATNASLWFLGWSLYARFRGLFDSRHLPAYLGPSTAQLAHLTVLSLVCAGTSFALLVMLVTTAKSWVVNRTMIEEWEVERHEALLSRHGVHSGSSSARNGATWWAVPEEEEEEEEEEGDDDKEEDGTEDSADDDDAGDRNGHALRMRRVEFPYDVGFWRNMSQAMGTSNPLAWFWPFAGGPMISSSPSRKGPGWEWEENGFNPREGMWPPRDPERERRARAGGWPGAAAMNGGTSGAVPGSALHMDPNASPEEQLAAFRARQERDMLRRQRWQSGASGIIAELEETEELADLDADGDDAPGYGGHRGRQFGYYERGIDGEPGWTNSEGDRLRDYGVDEDEDEDGVAVGVGAGRYHIPTALAQKATGSSVNYYKQDDGDDDEDVPLGELIRRRKATAASQTGVMVDS